MISHAFIQEQGNGQLREEEQLVFEELNCRGIPIALYTAKRILRRQLPLNSESLVVGDMPCILAALKQLAIPEPEPNDYPASLSIAKTILTRFGQDGKNFWHNAKLKEV